MRYHKSFYNLSYHYYWRKKKSSKLLKRSITKAFALALCVLYYFFNVISRSRQTAPQQSCDLSVAQQLLLPVMKLGQQHFEHYVRSISFCFGLLLKEWKVLRKEKKVRKEKKNLQKRKKKFSWSRRIYVSVIIRLNWSKWNCNKKKKYRKANCICSAIKCTDLITMIKWN